MIITLDLYKKNGTKFSTDDDDDVDCFRLIPLRTSLRFILLKRFHTQSFDSLSHAQDDFTQNKYITTRVLYYYFLQKRHSHFMCAIEKELTNIFIHLF